MIGLPDEPWLGIVIFEAIIDVTAGPGPVAVVGRALDRTPAPPANVVGVTTVIDSWWLSVVAGQPLLFINSLKVEPGYRGRGIGTQLMRAAIDFCDHRGMTSGLVAAADDDIDWDVEAWYKRLGYIDTEGGIVLVRPAEG